MAASPFTAASEFGFDKSDAAGGSSAQPQPATTLKSVEQAASGAWYQHPGVALFGLVAVAAIALERTTKPVAGARVSGELGPAKAGIEGAI